MYQLILATALLGSEPNAYDQALIEAGRRIGVQSIKTGQVHPTLQKLAQDQANYCAYYCVQGHQLWSKQFQDHYRHFPQIRSVVAESWPHQSLAAGSAECFESWQISPGHWAHCNSPCRYYGLAIARGKNGVWYGCGIFSD